MFASKSFAIGFSTLLDINDYRDAEGRALGEHRASAIVREAMPLVLKQCPYAGSRHQHVKPMNVSALKQLTQHWDDTLAGIALVRQHYLRRRSLSAVQQDSDCLAIGEAVAALPSFLLHRAHDPVAEGTLDARVASLYKVIIGLNRVYAILISGQMMTAGQTKTKVISAPDVVASFSDAGGFLIGAEQVCAGSARQIGEAIEAVISGYAGPGSGEWLQALLGPMDRFLAFAHGMRRLGASKILLKTAAALAVARVLSRDGGDEIKALLEAQLAAQDAPGTIRNFAATRDAEQLDRLVQGWFELAGGTGRFVEGADSRAWGERLAAALARARPALAGDFVATLAGQLAKVYALERRMLQVVQETERQLNVALGRPPAKASRDARALARGFDVDVIGSIATALDLELDA